MSGFGMLRFGLRDVPARFDFRRSSERDRRLRVVKVAALAL
jgi:hypothetical protein